MDALPMPLGSLSTRGLAGPNGTPLIGELPAPAEPAGGVSCAYALGGVAKVPSSRAIARAQWRDIESFRACLTATADWATNSTTINPMMRRVPVFSMLNTFLDPAQ
jgi:hypothetical protein